MPMSIEKSVQGFLVAAGMIMASVTCVAQQPKITHAQLSVKSDVSLQQEIQTAQASTWIGYAIPVTHRMNSGWDNSVLHLEGEKEGGDQIISASPDAAIPPAAVLLRVTEGKVERVQIEQMDREIEAGGLPFVWLANVTPVDSVRTLKKIVEANIVAAGSVTTQADDDARRATREAERSLRRVQDSGIVAIALTDTPEATSALRSLTATTYPEQVRERAAFWLANERGSEGFKAVSELLRNEHDDVLREKLVFDLTLVKGDSKSAAIDELIATAKSDASPKVRSQAQFWLAQVAGKKAGGDPRIVQTLRQQASDDPDAAIRKSAVFALSRLPEEQGVPELIQVASISKDAATRHEAIFWLGKSKDPRALAYLEKVVRE
jgi:HEAT repeat protein